MTSLFQQGDLEFAHPQIGWERQRPPFHVYALVTALFVLFFVAIIWAAWAKLDEMTSGEGRVIPSSQIQIVQNLEGGIVRDIRVHEGEVVTQGQLLLNIDNSTFVASFG